jgi:hypothetical protein
MGADQPAFGVLVLSHIREKGRVGIEKIPAHQAGCWGWKVELGDNGKAGMGADQARLSRSGLHP